MNKIPFYHVSLTLSNTGDVLSEIDGYFSSDRPHTVFFLNSHCFNIAANDLEYREILNNSELVLNDGGGIEIASRLANIKLQGNLNGTDLIPEIVELADRRGKKLFLLGAKPAVTGCGSGVEIEISQPEDRRNTQWILR